MNVEAKRYEDTEPYIFISYSHADRERVLAIVAALDERGYRVWYDAGIYAGEEWTQSLEKHIAGCDVFLPFISRAFVAPKSKYCRKEVLYAEEKDKLIIPVRLDDSDLPDELKFLLGRPQQLRPAPDETPEAFAARLDTEPLFQRCRRVTVSDAVVTRNRPVTPSEEFVGRETIMRDITQALDGDKPVILYGPGGIGKSEICRKLFQKYAEGAGTRPAGRLGWAMWRGTLKETFYGQFPGITDANIDAHWQKAQAYMRTLGADLLMFLDNADNITETDEGTLTKLGCRFLITSRQTEHSERVRTIRADSLTPEECRTLYRRAYPNNAAPDSVLDEIITLAGRHTLAVRLLAKTQRAARLSAEALLDKLRKSDFDLRGKIKYRHTPEDDADSTASEKGVFIDHMSRIFVLSRLRDAEDGEDALRVLQGMSLLAPNTPIAFAALDKWLGLDGDFDGLNCAIDTGWLNETPDGVSIHAVIAAVVRKNAMPDETLIDALAGRLRLDMIPEETEVFRAKLPVLAHAVALDKVVDTLRTVNYGKMLNRIGHLLNEQGDYDTALSYSNKAINITKEILGASHLDMAVMYNTIGYSYLYKDDYANALKYYKKDLQICKKLLGPEHSETGSAYNDIGAVYFKRGNYPSALKLMEKSLQISLKSQGIYHPSTATSYNNIGLIYDVQGDKSRALEWYNKALEVREKVLGPENPETATSYHNIGTLYFEQGHYKEALQWLEKALAGCLKVLGPEHPSTKLTQKWIDDTKRELLLDAIKRALSGEE